MSKPTGIILSEIVPPPTGEGETIQIVVTVQNNQFYFNGELQSEFKLIHGNTYVFQQNAGENGHVLGISAVDGGASVAGITYSYQTSPTGAISNTLFSTYDLYLTNPAYASALSNWNFFLTYTVPADGPDTLYFFSSSSAVTGGVFNVGSAYVAPEPLDADDILINENEVGALVGVVSTTDEDAGDTHTYTLSGADADLFEIVDGKLKLKGSISVNYENTPLLNVTLTSTDSTNQSVSQDFVIKVADQNDSPTGVLISSLRVEDATDGIIVGILSTVDQDTNDTYTYTLSGDDADKFEVVDGQLKLKDGVAADYETQSTYSVTVTSTDSGGETAAQTFTLNVVTTINLTSYSFAENTAGVLIGDLSVTDETFSSNVTYALSGADGDQFEIVNNQLKLKDDVSANFEVKDTYAIVITVTDDAGLEAIINFSLSVTDQPDAPTAISLSQAEPEPPAPPPTGEGETIQIVVTVQNNQFYFNGELQSEFKLIHGNTYVFQQNAGENGHVLGISAVDGGASVAGITYSYQTSPTGAISNTLFSTYDLYLTNPAYASALSNWNFFLTYTVPADGPDTLYFFSSSSAVTGGVFNVGSAYVAPPPSPTPVDPDAIVINENELGAVVGTLLTTDEDAGDTHTYTLSGADADLFEIVDGKLKLKGSISVNYENTPLLNVTLTSTDSTNQSVSQDFVIKVADQNDSPTGVLISSLRVEDATDGIIVGILSTVDQDTNDTYTYTLSGDDADKFEVVDGQLKLKDGVAADYETQSTYSVTVTSTDSGGETAAQTFTLNVVTTINLTSYSFAENTAGVLIGDLSVTDETFSSNVTYALSGADGDQFEIVNNQLKLKDDVSANFEVKDTYAIVITVTDDAGLEAIINFSLSVTDQPDAPTAISLSQAEPEPPAPPPTGEGETIQIVVTVQNNQFYFNGELQSEFKLIHGNTYVFQQNAGENGHVLGISAVDGGASVAGITYSYQTSPTGAISNTLFSTYDLYLTNPAYASALSNWNFFLTYTVPADGPDTLYFFSSSSAVTGGVFNVGSAYVAPPPSPTPVDPDAIVINENELGAVVGTLLTTDEDAGDTHTYTLSGADADLFEIVDGKLKLKGSISVNYENTPLLNVTLTSTDSTNQSVSQDFVIKVADQNDSPTGVLISSLRVEDATDGIIVGILSTVDQDTNDTYTYTLSGDDADKFEVVDGQLKLKDGVAADYETQSTYSVTVTSTDSGGETAAQTFTLNVVTTINLTSYSFAENTAGVLIGDLSVTDETFSSNVTYALSGADGDQFEIVNNQLKLKDDVSANFEVKDTYAIVITVTDDAGLEAIINFSLSVTDQPDAPTAISLSQAEPEPPAPPPTGEGETIQIVVTVQNNQFYFNGELQSEFKLIHGNTYVFQQNAGENGHVLGISAVDGGASVAGITYSYQTSPTGAISNTLFSTYDLYLTNPAYASALSNWNFFLTYTVPADGPDTLYFFSSSSAVTGGVFNVGSAYVAPPPSPTPVDPDAIVINENELGAVVGTLLTTDEDAGDTHTYTLSGADADLFEIVDGKLKLKDSIASNYEVKNLLNISITATDSTGLSFTQAINVTVNNVNEQPTQVNLSKTSFDEAIAGAIVGTLSTVDEDIDDTYTYTLSGDDADKFEVVDGQLKLKDSITADYETLTTYSVTVTSTDSGGLSLSQAFALTVSNVNEPVTSITLGTSNFAIVSEGIKGQVIETFIINDPDIGEERTYLLTGQDAKYFEVVNGVLQLRSDIALDYEALNFTNYDSEGSLAKSLYVTVTVIDSGGYTAKNNFQIQVQNTNDAPYNIILEGLGINGSNGFGGDGQGVVGKIIVSDQDDNVFSFSVDNDNFEIVDGYLRVKSDSSLSAELWDNLLISVTATDSGNNSFTQSFNLTHISVGLDSYSFQENVTDAVVAHITQSVKSEEYLSGWTTSLSGSDARFFKINSDNDIQYIGTADYESKSSYDIVIVFTHSSGLSYESMHTIDVLDRNDSPLLWYSHANNLNIYSSDSWMESRYLFGVKEEVTNPYIMTLEFGDQDLNDTHSIQITYKEYLGYYYDENGNPVFSYGDAINITDLFTFDAETGALYFNGQVDFESISGDLSGLNSTHDWHDPITISITDSSGASDTMTVLMQAFDSSSDGSIDVSYTGAYTNFSNELSWPLWRGPKDWDTNKSPELIDLVSGDINGDGLQDYIAFYTNSDYIYPYTYSSLVVSLGGPTLFPYYQPDVYTWSGDESWNSILGNGLGSVIVQLPARFLSDYGDIRYSSFWGLQTGDFNGDGKDDILLELDDYIIVGYGQNFDSSSAQNSNIMDLSDIASDQSNGFILNLSDYSDSYINMKGVGDFDGDGKVDIVLWDYDNSLIILNGDSTSEFLLTKTTLNGDSLQANMGFGSDIAIGDFNGDGKIDLAVAAPLYDKIPGTNSNEGAIYIYLNLLNFAGSSPDVVIEGGNAGDEIGYWGILNLGDINGDGIDDLGFGDVDDISYILWGSSILSPSYNLGNELFVETPTSTSFTGIDSGVAGFDITNVTAVGDINGDGYDDLAASAYDKVLILYGQSSWETIYLTSEGLNFLSILQDNAYPDIYALGDLDDDGKDEFGFTYASSNAYTDDDVLRIWNGSDPSLDLNGFSLQLKNVTFSVDENLLGADIGTLETSTDHNLSNFSLYIVATYDDNWDVIDSNLFEIGSDGTIRLKAGISLDAETSSTYNLRIYIVDQVKDQINQQYITVNVNNINEAPSFALSNRVVDGNAAAGTVIGVLSSTDLDGDDVTFTLSGSDAGMFVIDPATSEIRFADGVIVDTNSQVSFNVTITALDSFGLESSEDISIEVNLAPTDITLDTNLVQESVRGAAIGQLHVTDENISDEFTYTISGEDAWMFNITSEGVLELSGNVFADFESMESINITIHATDLLGKSISKDFTIYTKDINYSNPSISDTIFSNFVIPLSGNPIIDSLLFGFTLDPDHDSSTPLSITYSIIGLDSTFDYDGYDGAVAARVEATDSFVSAIDEIFEYLGNLLGISFIKVEETADVVGDIRCGLTNLPDAGWLGVCEITGDYLGNLDNSLFETSSRDSDIWINMAFNSMDENNVTPGTTIYETIIHELGHSLGLKHPQQTFQYTELEWYENQGYTTESIYNYFLETFGYDLQYDDVDHLFTSIHQTLPRLFNGLDSNAYSIMSYDEYAGDDWSESKNSGVSGVVACGICGHSHGGDSHNTAAPKIIDINSGIQVAPSTFMSFDIFALMYIYNYDESSEAWSIPNFNEGDTTYVIDGPVFMSIHDTGGNDTIDLSAFNFDITFNMSFMGYTVDPNTGEYEFSYQYNEIGTNLLSYKDGQNYSGYIINVSPFTEIENLVLGGGNDTVYADFMGYNTANEIHAGTGNDLVYQVAVNDTIYAEEGNDFISALSTDFNLVDGGEGYDILTISQKLLDSGLYSVDLRDLTQGQIHGIEEFAYYENLLGQGQILISLQTFKSMSQSTLTIKHTWLSGNVQAVGLEGDFVLSGSTDAYDIYSISDAGQNYSLFVWKDHYVYQIDDSPIDLNLSNSFVFDGIWTVVGGLSISGESWINPDKTWHNSNPTPMYSLSGEDAEYFEIRNGELHLISKPDYELKQSYTITISVVSFSGKTESKDFIIEVKDWDEAIETSGNDVIAGTDGSDFLYGGSGDDEISGGKGNDYIFGSIGSDLLRGDEGDDRILGEGNNDEIYGGDGNDTIFGDSGDDSLFGDAGNDLIYGNDGNDTAEGGSGDDVILGLNGDDNLYGDSETGENNTDGNDTLYGGQGNDSIWGRGGNDIIYGSTGNDKLNGGSGDDIIRGGNDDDILVGQFGNDTLSGDSGNDILYGDRETGESSDDGNDILWGGFGNDELYGRGGDDYLVGQNGLDVLTGGEGADTFVLTSYSSSDSRDTIKDYVDGTDKIGLIGIDFDSLTISQDVNAVDTNIFDAGGNIIAVLEGVAATDIDAADFVSLDFDLLQILEVRPTMVNFDLIALGLELEAPSASNTDASDIGGASSIAPDKDNIVQPISNGGSSFNAMISGDLLDSLIDHQEDLNLTFNDFI